jgi:serine protease
MNPGDTVPNLVIAKLGNGGRVSIFNQYGQVHVIADVMAWIPDGVAYGALTPERLLDTRIGLGAPTGPVGPNGVVSLGVAGHGGVPNVGAGSVVLNVTVTEPTEPSYVTVWPNGEPQPGTSSLNMNAGQTRPNLVISKIGADGRVALANRYGSTHLIADVVGWIPAGSGYTGITPRRVLDTRIAADPLGTDSTRRLDPSKQVPADAVAVTVNLTITEPTAPTYITAWPSGVARPTTSNLNALPGVTRPVAVVVKLGTGRSIDLYNLAGTSHLVVDLVGWYGPGTATPLSLVIGHGLEPSSPTFEPGRPLSALADGQGPATDFITDELLVVAPKTTADQVASQFHGTVVSTTASLAGLQPIHVIRFDLDAIPAADLPTIAEALAILSANADGAGAALQVSDASGAKLLQLQARLIDDGHTAAINVITYPDGYADGLILEEGFDANKDGLITGSESFNAFDFPYLREGGPMDHGFTSAWQELDSYARLRPAAKVAVFDGGYFDSNDLGPMTLVGTSYLSENIGSCGGSPCPWHGTAVAHTIYGTHGNSIGTAGGATPVVTELVAIGVGRDVVGVLKGLVTLPFQIAGTDVLNISAGARIPAVLYAPLYLVLAPITLGIRTLGIQVVASAGNNGADVDDEDCFFACWESGGWIPCELPGVICVGGLKLDSADHDTGSNYGHEDVDIWSSYTVKIGPAPDQFNGITQRTISGTSFSAPLVTSAVALTIAANPSLSGPAAGDRVVQAARPGSGRVTRILDVQRAVHNALVTQSPFVEITSPAPNATLGYAGTVTLKANACCGTTPTYQWREGPRNGTLNVIATGQTPTLRITGGTGPRTLEVRATFPNSTVRTDRVDYTMTNQAPTVTMQRPLAGEDFFQSASIPLRANTLDEAYGTPMPNSLVTWKIDGVFAGTGNQINVTGLSLGSHTAEVTATDGNLSTKVSRQFDVLVDLGNPAPNVSITSPGTHLASDLIGDFVGPPYEYVFTATATATDVAPNPLSPTITWYWRVSGTTTEHLIGTGTVREVRLPLDGVPCAGVAWDVIARATDGNTVGSDFIQVTYFPLC